MKTPEEMAEDWILDNRVDMLPHPCKSAFLAGYKAAKDNQEYLMNEMSILRSRLDTAEKLSQLVDENKEQ